MDQTLDCVPVRQPKTDNIVVPPIPVYKLPYNESNKGIPNVPSNKIGNIDNEPKKDVLLHGKQTNALVKPFMTSSKPTDVLLRNLHQSLRQTSEDTEYSLENSLSISKIADYLGE